MKTQVLLSSVTTLPFLEASFRLAHDLQFHGLELMPYRWTDPEAVRYFSQKYDIPVKGIHLPFWAKKKPFWKVLRSERDPKEKVFACVWLVLFGSAHRRCRAAILGDRLPEAYVLVHPDTFHQINHPGFFAGRTVYFENERPKLEESEQTHNPYLIRQKLIPACQELFPAKLMLDPGHLQIAQRLGEFPEIPLPLVYRKLQPEGLHLSFSGGKRLHDLPTDEEWQELVKAVKEHPPNFLVVETKPGPGSVRRVEKARDMIGRDLGL